MTDLLLRYGIPMFDVLFLVLFFFLSRCRIRHKHDLPIPRCVTPMLTPYHYHLSLMWIALYACARFLFVESDPDAHVIGFAWLCMSFANLIVALNIARSGRIDTCDLH